MAAIPIARIAHCNVNCSSIERSRRFYEDVVGLKATSHMHPDVQKGGGFPMGPDDPGLVQWDAYAMVDSRGGGWGPVLDLLEWKVPQPVGQPYASANHLGFGRLAYRVPSVADAHARFVAAGATVLSSPTLVDVGADGQSRTFNVFMARDPDGTLIELAESADVAGVEPIHVNVNCSDLSRSREWYARNLGFDEAGRSAPGPQSGAAFGLHGDCDWEAVFLSVPCQQGRFLIDLRQWKVPTPVGVPYQTANNLGIYRMAFTVEDIHACYETLMANGVSCSGPPVKLDMGPDLPIDGLWALFFTDPDGTCLELIESPRPRSG